MEFDGFHSINERIHNIDRVESFEQSNRNVNSDKHREIEHYSYESDDHPVNNHDA